MPQIEEVSGKVSETSTDTEYFTDMKNIEQTLRNIEDNLESIRLASCYTEEDQWDFGKDTRYQTLFILRNV